MHTESDKPDGCIASILSVAAGEFVWNEHVIPK